jgi:N-sulfoglucosamine sulfohydrolase
MVCGSQRNVRYIIATPVPTSPETHACEPSFPLALLLAAAVAPAAEKPRNILLLVADDLGCDLGCYGNSQVKTPNLDALAGRGVRFSHAFATVASCSASRAVIYTGQYTHSNGQYGHAHAVHNLHTFANVPSLPKALKENGYRTGILGKLHVQPASVYPSMRTCRRSREQSQRRGCREEGGRVLQADEKPFLLVVGYGDTPDRQGLRQRAASTVCRRSSTSRRT